MGLKIAEFFAELGVRGSEQSVNALGQVDKGMKNVYSSSVATKIAILAAFYEVGKFVKETGESGTAMENFSAVTDMSIQKLQKFQIAARRASMASFEDTQQTLTNLQKMVNLIQLTGQGLPQLSPFVLGLTKMTQQEFRDAAKSSDGLLMKLGEFAVKMKKLGRTAQASVFLDAFHLSPDMQAAAFKGAFSPENIARTRPLWNDQQVDALDKANKTWAELELHIKRAFGNLNAAHGGEWAKDIEKLTDAAIRLVNALEKAGIFKLFTNAASAVMGVAGDLIDPNYKYGQREKDKKAEERIIKDFDPEHRRKMLLQRKEEFLRMMGLDANLGNAAPATVAPSGNVYHQTFNNSFNMDLRDTGGDPQKISKAVGDKFGPLTRMPGTDGDH